MAREYYDNKHLDYHLNVYCFFARGGVYYHLDDDLNDGGLTWGFMNQLRLCQTKLDEKS